MSAVIGF